MLHMDYDVEVVEQDPAALALTLAADQFRAGRRIRSSISSTMARTCRSLDAEHSDEGVRDHELLAHVIGDYAVGQLVRSR